MKPWRRKILNCGQPTGMVAVAFVLMLWPLSPAAAHALVVASTPSANAAIAGPAFDLRVQFSDRIDKRRSKLSLLSAAGQAFPVQPLDDDSADTLAGHVAGLSAGPYRLQWQVLAVDGHITRGEIPFTVTAP
jgi:methionine-rich copper-binding protein CopC